MVTSVPGGIDEVTPQWLTTAFDDATVTDIQVEQIALDTGFSSQLYRAHLSGNGVPDSVIVKLPAVSAAGDAMKMLGGYAREVDFYRLVAGRGHRGQLDDHAVRHALTRQVCSVQLRREAAIECDLFDLNIGDRRAVKRRR